MNAQTHPSRIRENDVLRQRLSHVYWIGGSPCSGKSSIAAWLQERYALTPYSCDDAFGRHAKVIEPGTAPTLYRVTHMAWEELWMRPVETLLQDAMQVYWEEWPMIVDDLLTVPADRPVVAEGAALTPGLLHEVLADPHHAIWVVPSEAFQREHYPRRGEWVNEILSHCSQPEQALRNWMDRDVAFARHVSAEAQALGLHMLPVDGGRSIEENAALVDAQFRLGDQHAGQKHFKDIL